MSRILLIAVVVVATATATAGAFAEPSLRIVTRSPLVVSGVHFRSGERITVSAGQAKVVVRAGAAGAFRANLGTPLVDRCSQQVVAIGARGDRAQLIMAARAMCAPASTP